MKRWPESVGESSRFRCLLYLCSRDLHMLDIYSYKDMIFAMTSFVHYVRLASVKSSRILLTTGTGDFNFGVNVFVHKGNPLPEPDN